MKGTQLHLFSNEDNERGTQTQRHALVFPLDTTILILVVMILLLTLSFSLGVEKGRRNAVRSFEKERQILLAEKEASIARAAALPLAQPAEPPVIQEQPVAPVVTVTAVPRAQPAIPAPATKPDAVANEPVKNNSGRYLIQLASYGAKEPAQTELKKVLKNGHRARIDKKGKFFVILVGEFKDEKSAKTNLETLRQQYKDCILKKL